MWLYELLMLWGLPLCASLVITASAFVSKSRMFFVPVNSVLFYLVIQEPERVSVYEMRRHEPAPRPTVHQFGNTWRPLDPGSQ